MPLLRVLAALAERHVAESDDRSLVLQIDHRSPFIAARPGPARCPGRTAARCRARTGSARSARSAAARGYASSVGWNASARSPSSSAISPATNVRSRPHGDTATTATPSGTKRASHSFALAVRNAAASRSARSGASRSTARCSARAVARRGPLDRHHHPAVGGLVEPVPGTEPEELVVGRGGGGAVRSHHRGVGERVGDGRQHRGAQHVTGAVAHPAVDPEGECRADAERGHPVGVRRRARSRREAHRSALDGHEVEIGSARDEVAHRPRCARPSPRRHPSWGRTPAWPHRADPRRSRARST